MDLNKVRVNCEAGAIEMVVLTNWAYMYVHYIHNITHDVLILI